MQRDRLSIRSKWFERSRMTLMLLRKVSHTGMGFYTKAPASRVDHRFAKFVLKLERSFNEST